VWAGRLSGAVGGSDGLPGSPPQHCRSDPTSATGGLSCRAIPEAMQDAAMAVINVMLMLKGGVAIEGAPLGVPQRATPSPGWLAPDSDRIVQASWLPCPAQVAIWSGR